MKSSLLIFLPDDILYDIYLYIQNESNYLLNKTNYEKHYVNIINSLRKAKYNSYIRFIIRNDYSYLFDNLLKHKYNEFHIKNKIIAKPNEACTTFDNDAKKFPTSEYYIIFYIYYILTKVVYTFSSIK